MKSEIKKITRELAKELELRIKFVNYLGAKTHGKLLGRERLILVNAHKARCEHIFTILHEMGHYLFHVRKLAPDRFRPRYLNIHWKSDFMQRLASAVRRHVRFIFHKPSGKEWEADMVAMCLLLQIAPFAGTSELWEFLELHPEKWSLFMIAACGTMATAVKVRLERFRRGLFKGFQTA